MDSSHRITEFFNLINKPNRPNAAEVRDAVKVRNELLPGRLYRYRGCTDYAFDNLKNSSLWLSSPDDFNDPFDCSLSVLKMTFVEHAFASNVEKFLSSPPWDANLSAPEKQAVLNSPNPFREFGSILFVRT